MRAVTLAIDAGGTKLLGGLVAHTGEVLVRRQVPTPRANDVCDPGLTATTALARSLRDDAGAGGLQIVGAGLGFPEYVHDNEVTSREVFGWTDQPALALGRVLPGCPVSVEADVRCAAQAEAAARERSGSPIVYISWGTGLSSAVVFDGTPVPGRRGEALALGEWPVLDGEGRPWPGTLETFASGRGMHRRYQAATGSEPGRPVALLAAEGDPVAEKILSGATSAVAAALAQLVLFLDPAVIVVGGGIGSADGEAVQRVRQTLPGLLHRPDPPSVEAARTGADAGLVGAGLGAWRLVDAG